jgi:hypothetical protein
MPFYASTIGEVLIIFVTFTTQIAIARLFFLEWKKLLTPRVALAATWLLYGLWVAYLFAIPFRSHRLTHLLSRIPTWLSGTLIAIGNIWGTTAVASLAVFPFNH